MSALPDISASPDVSTVDIYFGGELQETTAVSSTEI